MKRSDFPSRSPRARSALASRVTGVTYVAVLGLLALSFPPAARGFEVGPAVPGTWSALGPDGGHIEALALHPTDPKILYAGGMGGVFRSTNGGASWTPASRGLARNPNFVNALRVGTLQIDRAHPDTLYAGSEQGGLGRSTDGGATWSYVDAGLAATGILSLALDPIEGKRLFAATYFGLYRSGDRGETWRLLTRGLPSGKGSEPSLVTLDPVEPQTVYAVFPEPGTQGQTVYKSTNAGATWRPISTGPLRGRRVRSFAVHPRTRRLFAGCDDGFLVSTDGGATWRERGLPFLRVNSLLVHPGRLGVVYANTHLGIYRTGNNGVDWSLLYRFPNDIEVHSLAFSPAGERILYAGTTLGRLGPETGGVFKSLDSGASWRFSGAGLRTGRTNSFAIDPKDSAILWLGSGQRLWKSSNRGESWTRLRFDIGCAATYSYSIDLDPTAPETAYLKVQTRESRDGVCATRDGGATWSRILTSNGAIGLVRVDPQRPATLYAAGAGILKSLDRGATWTRVGGAPQRRVIADLLLADRGPAAIYAPARPRASSSPFQLLRSTDSGASWASLGTPSGSTRFEHFALDPFDSQTLYAVEDRTLRRSTDGGLHWSVLLDDIPAPENRVRTSKSVAGRLYLAVPQGDVYQSDDGGATWNPLGTRFDSYTFTPGIFLADDPADPNRLYVGAVDGPVFLFARTE